MHTQHHRGTYCNGYFKRRQHDNMNECINSLFYNIIITVTIVKNNESCTLKYVCSMVAKKALQSLSFWPYMLHNMPYSDWYMVQNMPYSDWYMLHNMLYCDWYMVHNMPYSDWYMLYNMPYCDWYMVHNIPYCDWYMVHNMPYCDWYMVHNMPYSD